MLILTVRSPFLQRPLQSHDLGRCFHPAAATSLPLCDAILTRHNVVVAVAQVRRSEQFPQLLTAAFALPSRAKALNFNSADITNLLILLPVCFRRSSMAFERYLHFAPSVLGTMVAIANPQKDENSDAATAADLVKSAQITAAYSSGYLFLAELTTGLVHTAEDAPCDAAAMPFEQQQRLLELLCADALEVPGLCVTIDVARDLYCDLTVVPDDCWAEFIDTVKRLWQCQEVCIASH